MDGETALGLFQQAIGAGFDAELVGQQPRDDTQTLDFQLRVRSAKPGVSLGPDVLKAAAEAGASIGASDVVFG